MRSVNVATPDRVALGLVIFFVACNMAFDAAWLAFGGTSSNAAAAVAMTGPCRRLAAAGWGACGPGTPVDMAREALNGTVTQILEIWLLVALLLRRPERHALQLAVGSYVVYAFAIDAWLDLVAAIHGMPPSVTASVPSIVVAAIRVAGHLYLVYAAVLAIMPCFRPDARSAGPAAGAVRRLRSRA